MRRTLVLLFACMGVGALFATSQSACGGQPFTRAKRIEHRAELIGGPRALGEVGDWLLENNKIRVIIQDQGFSRGFGVFGGSLIDADLVRTGTGLGDSEGGVGRDNFGELFPAFFLEALEPLRVNDPNGDEKLPAFEIENDGTNGQPAVLVVRGYGNDFLALTQLINENLLGDNRDFPTLLFESRYILEPDANYVTITTTVQNVNFEGDPIEWNGAEQLLGTAVPIPFGDVALFGAGNHVFLPHEAGYDLRYRLEDIYGSGQYSLPALPGLVADFIASSGPGVSYGLALEPVDDPARNFAMSSGQFEDANLGSMHVPFIASAFTGVFQVVPPVLEPNDGVPGGPDEFSFTRYFIVGNGDVASVSDTVYALRGTPVATLSGELFEETTRQPLEGAEILIERAGGQKVTQCTPDANGKWRANLPEGDYLVRAFMEGRAASGYTAVTVGPDGAFLRLTLPAEARVTVNVSATGEGRIPAKATLVGVYDETNTGKDTKEFLFDLSIGEAWRFTDLETDDAGNPNTRRYMETFAYARNGSVTLVGRPGTYTVVVSHGPEYTVAQQVVTLRPGQTEVVNAELTRVVDTTGYVAGDFHLHTRFSLDSSYSVHDSLIGYAAEGLEYVVSTDHNFVVDFAPVLVDLEYQHRMQSAVGLELTTIDRGHFNAFPLEVQAPKLIPTANENNPGGYDNTIAARTQGSFQWALRPPDDIFADLRQLGRRTPPAPDCVASSAVTFPLDVILGSKAPQGPLAGDECPRDTLPIVIQVNHPRDSILGYFEQYGIDQDILEPVPAQSLFAPKLSHHPEFAAENFSWNFDAMEVFNGKRYEYLHNFVVPEGVTMDPVSCCPLTPGELFRDLPPFPCDEEEDNRICTCLPSDTQAQIDAGACNPDGRPVAYPGVIDDWFEMMNRGLRVIGTANSDSHDPHKDESGSPRTFFAVPNDIPGMITPDDMVAAFQKGDVLMTNGPFVSVTLDGKGMGEMVVPDGAASLAVKVQAPPWIKPNRAVVYLSGEVVHDEQWTPDEDVVGTARVHEFTVDINAASDGFVVVEVTGDNNMFPMVFPNEIPPLQFTDVINAIGGSFGLGGGPGSLRPQLTYQVTPFAMTNPIWIDADGDGEISPRRPLVEPSELASTVATPVQDAIAPIDLEAPATKLRRLRRTDDIKARFPTWLHPTRDIHDIRRVLFQFAPHAH